MEARTDTLRDRLEHSTQINDGLSQTSADAAALAFDKKYGIMFCAYMPGMQGRYGESRGKVSLSYFPASQPTNIRFVTVVQGNAVYCHNILGLGDGRVRVFYEKDSYADGDHTWCYKDFDFISDSLSSEHTVMVRQNDGSNVPLCLSAQFRYLEAHGYHDHEYVRTEQVGHCAYHKGKDGYTYGAALSCYAEPILFRSTDDGATVEFFAVYPKPAQYEFEYRFLNGQIYAIYRTDKKIDSICFTCSVDMGKTWREPTSYPGSIPCRPRMLVYNGHILTCHNYFNATTKHRPPFPSGRTSVRLTYGEDMGADKGIVVADLYSKYGMVNVCLADIFNDLYLAYSTSEVPLEYQNYPYDDGVIHGKDSIRYVKLGDLLPE